MLLCAKAKKGSDPFSVIKCFGDKLYAIQVNYLFSLESFYKSPVFFQYPRNIHDFANIIPSSN
jgi:hypothetical protein